MSAAMTSELLWAPPPADLALPDGELHVWRAALDLPAPAIPRLRDTLAADEIDRADRFRAPRSRDHFIAARGLLSEILGRYLGAPPDQLRFYAGPAGKPALAAPESSRLSFNLSHCQDLALCAVARDRAIGADIERIRAESGWERIAARHLAPSERARRGRLPVPARCATFFAYWTCNCKATGAGLAQPLSRVATAALRPWSFRRVSGFQTTSSARKEERWTVH